MTDVKHFGRCHICTQDREIAYCPACDHWFCGRCRWRYFNRGLEAIKEMVKGKHEGCCGPNTEKGT